MPACSNFLNSDSARRNFSGSNLLAFAKTGLPEVSMECVTPWVGFETIANHGWKFGKECADSRGNVTQ
jgi:hypothetical protein